MAVTEAPIAPASAPAPSTGGRSHDRLRHWALGVWSVLALLYLFIPVFIVVLFSFNDNQGRFNFTWQGFTLRHWQHPFADPDLSKALTNSIEIAVISTLIAVGLGTFMAMALVRYRFRGRSTVDFFVFMPLSSPEVVLGAALLGMFLTLNINTGFVTIVIAHVMFTMSYVVVTVKARLEGMDRHIEEASMDLGATEWVTFRKITLPMIAPGVAAAAMLAAAISFDDYVITSFNAGQTQTFPLFIFGATRQGVPAEVNVLATLLLLAVLFLMGLNVLAQKSIAKRERVRGGGDLLRGGGGLLRRGGDLLGRGRGLLRNRGDLGHVELGLARLAADVADGRGDLPHARGHVLDRDADRLEGVPGTVDGGDALLGQLGAVGDDADHPR